MLPMPGPSRQTLRVGTGLPLLAAKTKKRDPAPLGAGHFWPQRPAAQTLSVPPAAPFLSAVKEMGGKNAANGFWNSFRPITATPQKGPRRIAPAPIPAAASTCRGEMPYPTAVEQCTAVVRRSGSDKRTAHDSLYDDVRQFKSRVVRGGGFQRTPAAQEVLKPAVSSGVFGHFWGCGQK